MRKYDGVTALRWASGSSSIGYVLPTMPTVNVTLISESGYETESAASLDAGQRAHAFEERICEREARGKLPVARAAAGRSPR